MKKAETVFLLVFLLVYPVICSASAGSAPRCGTFGEMAGDEYADERLAELDQVSESLGASLATPDGAKIEIDQGYYVDDRVFISYRISPVTDLILLYEGAPEEGIEWDQVLEDWIMGDLRLTGFPDVDRQNRWLDGKGQRWLSFPYCRNEEYLVLEDGTRLDFIAGTELKLEDGTVIGWRECLVPADKAQDTDTGTFVVPVSYGKAIMFQDYSTFKENFGYESLTGIPVTLRHYGQNKQY